MTKDYKVGDVYKSFDEEMGGDAPSGGTLVRWGLGCLGIFLLLSLVGGVVGYANNWFNTGVQVISPDNVKTQWEFAYSYNESLKATTVNICQEKKVLADPTVSENEKSQRRTQELAYEQNYTRIEAQYDAALENAFKAKYVKPSDVPDRAPTLAESEGVYCAAGS